VTSQALNTKGIALCARGRLTEGGALIAAALELALDHDKPSAALRAYFNLADVAIRRERMQEAADLVRQGLTYARRAGNRYWEWSFLGAGYPFYAIGEWDEALDLESGLPGEEWEQVRIAFFSLLIATTPIRLHRGLIDEEKQLTARFFDAVDTADVQERGMIHYAQSLLALTEGRHADALEAAKAAMLAAAPMGLASEVLRESAVVLGESALALGDRTSLEELLATIQAAPSGSKPQFLDAQASRFRARCAEGEEADRLFRRAVASFRELEFPFYLAVTLLEHAEYLNSHGGSDALDVAAEATTIFERLRAAPWLARAEALLPEAATTK
jgi:tetratricopeptide (TPR) repeat protein